MNEVFLTVKIYFNKKMAKKKKNLSSPFFLIF